MTLLDKFINQIRCRSLENKTAFYLLYENKCYGICIGIIRQELDSLLRVSYLIENGNFCFSKFAFELVKNSVENGEWKYQNKKINDNEMLKDGWEKIVYKFACGLIHLSNKHLYKEIDPVVNLDPSEKEKIIDYLKKYHDYSKDNVTMQDIIEHLPNIYLKIFDNINFYLSEIIDLNQEVKFFN